MVADLGRAAVLAAVAVLAITDRLTLSLSLLIVLVIGFGLLSLGHDAASRSFVPRIAPRALLVRANVRLEQSTAVATTDGPAAAGVIITAVGAPIAILIDAVSYLIRAG